MGSAKRVWPPRFRPQRSTCHVDDPAWVALTYGSRHFTTEAERSEEGALDSVDVDVFPEHFVFALARPEPQCQITASLSTS